MKCFKQVKDELNKVRLKLNEEVAEKNTLKAEHQ